MLSHVTVVIRYQVGTQLQWAAARRVFPHFDEPMFKATFETTLVRKSHVVALSNSNLLSSEDRSVFVYPFLNSRHIFNSTINIHNVASLMKTEGNDGAILISDELITITMFFVRRLAGRFLNIIEPEIVRTQYITGRM